MDRRDFLKSATLATAATAATAGGAVVADSAGSQALAQAQAVPVGGRQGEPRMRRWTEQRWTLDNIIRANGMDWDHETPCQRSHDRSRRNPLAADCPSVPPPEGVAGDGQEDNGPFKRSFPGCIDAEEAKGTGSCT